MKRTTVVGFGLAAVLAFGIAAVFWPRRPETRIDDTSMQSPDNRVPSPLYQAFDPDKITAKYAKRFDSVSAQNSISGIEYTPLGELFRVSQMEGTVSDEEVQAVLADLRTEFVALAKMSGVNAADPKSNVGDRLIQLTMPFCSEIDTRTLQGFYLTYEWGAIDVFADKRGKDGEVKWRLTCMLHEKK